MNSNDAIKIRRARTERVRMIRHRVIAGALALFVALWLLITLMLVTGHDPALARQTKTSALTSTQGTAAQTGSTVTTSTTSTSAGSTDTGAASASNGSGSTVGGGTSSVTSRQS